MHRVPSSVEIVRQFVESLERSHPRSWNQTPWTRRVKGIFRKMGEANGFEVWPSDPATGKGEFMTDIGWYEGGGMEDRYRLVLVGESELDPDKWMEIDKDFDKLLHIKAPLKLFVFRSQRGDSHKESHVRICGFFNAYHPLLRGEEFILLEFSGLLPVHIHAYGYCADARYKGFANFRSGLKSSIRVSGVCGEADQFSEARKRATSGGPTER